MENSSAGNGGHQPLKKAKSQTDKDDHAWCSVVECGGQGACFYNSFGAAYGMQKDSMTWDAISKTVWSRGRTIRFQLADFICKRPQRYQEYLAFDPEAELNQERRQQLEDGPTLKDWDQYVDALKRPRR